MKKVVIALAGIALSVPCLAQSKLAFNYKVDTAGIAAPIVNYSPFAIDGLFGSKLDFQFWTFAGADPAEGTVLGGGAFVLHTPIAKNVFINIGIDCTLRDAQKPVLAGVIGFELLRF